MESKKCYLCQEDGDWHREDNIAPGIYCIDCVSWAQQLFADKQAKLRAEQDAANQQLLENCKAGKVLSCPLFCQKYDVNYQKLRRLFRKNPLTPAGFINHPEHGKYEVYYVTDLQRLIKV